MPVKFRCQHCKKLLGISSRKIGQIVDCPGCGRSVRVPAEDGVGKAAPPPEFDVNDPAIVMALDELASITKQPHALRPSGKASPQAEDDGWLEPEETPERPAPPTPPPPAPSSRPQRESTPTAYRPAPPPPAPPAPRREPVALAPVVPEVKELPPVPAPQPQDPPERIQATVFPAPPPDPRRSSGQKTKTKTKEKESSADRSDYSDHALNSSIPEMPGIENLAVTATTVGPPAAFPTAPPPNPSLLVSAELRRLAATPDPERPPQPEVRYHYVSQPAPASKLPMVLAGVGGLVVGLVLGFLGGVFFRPGATPAEKPSKQVATAPDPAEAPVEPEQPAVAGRLKYRKQGSLKPDEGAVLLFLPLQRAEGEKLSDQGLRPGDSAEDRSRAAKRLQALGGGLALVSSDGSYSAPLPATGDFAVVALSANQSRDQDSAVSPFLQNILDSWFDSTQDLLGQRAVKLDQLSYDGMNTVTWDYSFDAQ